MKKLEHKSSCPRVQAWDHGEWQAPCTCKSKKRKKKLGPWMGWIVLSPNGWLGGIHDVVDNEPRPLAWLGLVDSGNGFSMHRIKVSVVKPKKRRKP